MAQSALHHGSNIPTLRTSYLPQPEHTSSSESPMTQQNGLTWDLRTPSDGSHGQGIVGMDAKPHHGMSSQGKGVIIGVCSAFGSAVVVALLILLVYFLRYSNTGRIMLDRLARPGEFDDEQQFMREEEEAMAAMTESERQEWLRAKAFVQANPPESMQTDISLSQFLAIQEKGVSAWEFEPELEIANCFVEARTEIEFFDAECSVQSNLPIPKQNEVYYWEAKLYEKPETTTVNIGLTTKPYPLFRLPGFHQHSLAYSSLGVRRYNQPFQATPYAVPFVQGDVIGVGYRPRTGTVFFTRNGKKLEDMAHGLKSQNFFPTIGANGPASIHVNFGQAGFVFIEANVKKWGLAPQTGSLAPPPPYGSEQGSILLEGGQAGVREGQGWVPGHPGRGGSNQIRLARGPTAQSPGPQRSPTDISLAQLNLMDSQEEEDENPAGEGRSTTPANQSQSQSRQPQDQDQDQSSHRPSHSSSSEEPPLHPGLPFEPVDHDPPGYESPDDNDDDPQTPSSHRPSTDSDSRPLLDNPNNDETGRSSPPIPTYEAAVSDIEAGRGRSSTRGARG
ncbi:hypothetical protein MBLNU230_g5048t1 [Neophaeotheca triangularis]